MENSKKGIYVAPKCEVFLLKVNSRLLESSNSIEKWSTDPDEIE